MLTLRSVRPRVRRTRVVALTAAVVAAMACPVMGPGLAAASPVAAAEVSRGALAVSPAAASSTFPLADPDTVLARDGRYVTYGTTVGAGRGARCAGAPAGKLFVPMLVHGSGSTVGMANCASGDALPGGAGAWAEPNAAIWAPGVVRHKGTFFMYYTATKRGTGQKCIGVATSTGARGPFRNQREWACPIQGRWAIDANPFTDSGTLYVTYRDDGITTGMETGLSVVKARDDGSAIWRTRKDVLKSTDITWDTRDNEPLKNVHIVENPTMWKSSGVWYVAWSGNKWDSKRYATGIARCGTNPLPASRCTPLRNGVARPYFGYRGTGGLGPYRTLPGNHTGPGGMDVFKAADGTDRVVWHWWNGSRHPMTGVLVRNSGGFAVR